MSSIPSSSKYLFPPDTYGLPPDVNPNELNEIQEKTRGGALTANAHTIEPDPFAVNTEEFAPRPLLSPTQPLLSPTQPLLSPTQISTALTTSSKATAVLGLNSPPHNITPLSNTDNTPPLPPGLHKICWNPNNSTNVTPLIGHKIGPGSIVFMCGDRFTQFVNMLYTGCKDSHITHVMVALEKPDELSSVRIVPSKWQKTVDKIRNMLFKTQKKPATQSVTVFSTLEAFSSTNTITNYRDLKSLGKTFYVYNHPDEEIRKHIASAAHNQKGLPYVFNSIVSKVFKQGPEAIKQALASAAADMFFEAKLRNPVATDKPKGVVCSNLPANIWLGVEVAKKFEQHCPVEANNAVNMSLNQEGGHHQEALTQVILNELNNDKSPLSQDLMENLPFIFDRHVDAVSPPMLYKLFELAMYTAAKNAQTTVVAQEGPPPLSPSTAF